MGGWDDSILKSRNEVLQLDCPGDQISSCQWKQVGNLQFARAGHVAIALPESYDICKTTTTTDKMAQYNGIIAACSVLVLLFCCFLLTWKLIVPKIQKMLPEQTYIKLENEPFVNPNSV